AIRVPTSATRPFPPSSPSRGPLTSTPPWRGSRPRPTGSAAPSPTHLRRRSERELLRRLLGERVVLAERIGVLQRRRDQAVVGVPLTKFLAVSSGVCPGLFERRPELDFELVAQLLRDLELAPVTLLDGLAVLRLPALPADLCLVLRGVLGLVDGAVILGFPPLPSFLGFRRDPVGALLQQLLRLGGTRGALRLLVRALLLGLPLDPLHRLVGKPPVFRFPPRAQRVGLTPGARQRVSDAALVLGSPPLAELGGLAGGALLGFPERALFFSGPALA